MSVAKNAFLSTFSHLTKAVSNGTPLLRVTKPIVSAPMNAWSGPTLVAAVANHGGFPIYPIGYFTDPPKILKELQSILPLLKDLEAPGSNQAAGAAGARAGEVTGAEAGPEPDQFLPYGVGFITFWLDRQGPELLLDILKGRGDDPNRQSPPRPPAAVWFSFGNYKPYLKLIREHGVTGTKVIVQVQTIQEALEAQQELVDVIVLQGTESGGHGAQRVWPLMTLIPEAIQALEAKVGSVNASGSKLTMPAILAAGGISVASQFTAIQTMGASGAVIGTGFMPTYESPGPQHAKERLLKVEDGGAGTVRTRIFDELREFNWPEGYDGRVVRNLVTEREEEDLKNHGLYEQTGPAVFKLLKEDRTGTKEDWIRATKDQDFDLLPLWAGTGVGMLKKQVSAAEFMDQLLNKPN
ncbi:hypothetical protein BX616_002953 [Lobosporangium transversale]|uniref:Uncharacterized protein n=1 Tax=Lobosporangium transversale TaxID=64571 RepID=A0A1Y2GNJ0_9FUNG|nr:hypothetical protein BCR41DRAFT_356265 [Lobosporangium transversale]KAF9916739.1 hypothetical protein BX616_002953 [Lobosporangium transversale]ORZ12544.1 hypothetical protein BCR41DRAFT_356265 [Lobosporangium transversale]|eukprot:XP_021880163.1 hypothetical protein BCR41DRAFT_356265 [Lobosporangium transversale]